MDNGKHRYQQEEEQLLYQTSIIISKRNRDSLFDVNGAVHTIDPINVWVFSWLLECPGKILPWKKPLDDSHRPIPDDIFTPATSWLIQTTRVPSDKVMFGWLSRVL